jgi:predicted nucleic acid-binding protein
MSSPVWVVDTNVLVSGLLRPSGPPAQILNAVRDGRIRLAYSAAILSEYAEVLRRPRFAIPPPVVADLIEGIAGWPAIEPGRGPRLPDPYDEPFLALARVTPDRILITGNLADFPPGERGSVVVLSPAAALKYIPAV